MELLRQLKKSKSQNAQTAFNFLNSIVINLINFASVIIFSSLLGTSGYGQISLYGTYVQILSCIVGLQTFGTLGTARVYFKKEEISEYDSCAFTLMMISTLFFSIILFSCIVPISSLIGYPWQVIAVMILDGAGACYSSFFLTRYTYDKKAQKSFLFNFVSTILTLAIGVILTVLISSSDEKYLGKVYAAGIVAVLTIGFTVFFQIKRQKPILKKQYIRYCLVVGLPLIIHTLSHIVLSQSDKIMLKEYFGDYSSVGIYSLFLSYSAILTSIWSTLNNSWVPFYYDDVKREDSKAISEKSNHYLQVFSILCSGFLMVCPEIIRLFSSKDFWSGLDYFPMMILSAFFVFLYSFPVNFEFYKKRTDLVMSGTLFACLLNILLNYFFIRLWGSFGAAAATTISYFFLFVFHQLLCKFLFRKEYSYKLIFFLKGILAMGICVSLFYFFKDFWYIRWTLGAILGLLLVCDILKRKAIF